MNIAVFGVGYVGLVVGACFANMGHQVICIDIDEQKILNLQQGICPIHEPGLEGLIQDNLNQRRLVFTTNFNNAIQESALLFIAVGTPAMDDGSVDLQYIESVAHMIGQQMNTYKLIINKSTVPVGTAEHIRNIIEQCLHERNKTIPFDVSSNPEFLKEGSAIQDFIEADRVIIGTESSHVRELMKVCYMATPFDKLIFMSTRAAELTKYAANAMLATKISFINEIAHIAERLGVDIDEVRHGIGTDRRIGFNFINPGCGYGGSCFPKDIKALINTAMQHNYKPELLQAVESVNQRQQHLLFEKISRVFNGDLRDKTIAVWGLAFKPGTNDLREASSCVLLQELWQYGVKVQAYDPAAMEEAFRIYGQHPLLSFATSATNALEHADALVICTEWPVFKDIKLDMIKQSLSYPIVIDGRNLYHPEQMRQHGLLYYGIGKGNSCEHNA